MELDHQPQPPPPIDLVGGPFAVIESDPGVFTSLTRRLGIPGLELVELYDIEPWAVDHLHPHGLIFCFLWKKDAHRPTDFDDPAAERVWFANQLSDDACATHAILNVLLNCPGIELGEELSAFRRETEGMSPVMRGLAVTNSRVIRPAHNSLARPSDIRSSISNLAITTLDAEKQKEKDLKTKAKQDAKEKDKPPPAKRAKTTATGTKGAAKGKGKEKTSGKAKPKAKRKRKSKYDDDDDDEIPHEEEDEDEDGSDEEEEQAEEETYHFIGYVPAHGKVWELDGLKSGPLEVGELPSPPPSSSSSSMHPHDGWMDIARPALRLKMDKYGGSGNDGSNIRFSLLAIVDDAYRKAQDEWEFWRRDRVVLERVLGGIPKTSTETGWQAMVDPTLLVSADSAFTPPVYPLPPSASVPPVELPAPGAVDPSVPSTSDSQRPPTPQPINAPQAQNQTSNQNHRFTPTNPLKPFARDFASRRMERDMQIMRLAECLNTQSKANARPNSNSAEATSTAESPPNSDTKTTTGPTAQAIENAVQELVREWEKCVREGMRAKVALEDEIVKGVRANTDHIKRTFDYDPFIRAYLTHLKEEQLLNPLLGRDEEGRKVRAGGAGRGRGRGRGRGKGVC